MGGVPVLEMDDGACLRESNAILAYLARDTACLPGAPVMKAQILRWMIFEQRYIQTSVSRLRNWTRAGKRDGFAAQVPTAEKLGNRS